MRICNDCQNAYYGHDVTCPACKSTNTKEQDIYADSSPSGTGSGVHFGGGVWTWLIVVLLFNVGIGVYYLSLLDRVYSSMEGIVIACGALSIVYGMLALLIGLTKKRWPYYVMCGLGVVLIIINFALGSGVKSLQPIIPLAITFLVLRNYWQDMR